MAVGGVADSAAACNVKFTVKACSAAADGAGACGCGPGCKGCGCDGAMVTETLPYRVGASCTAIPGDDGCSHSLGVAGALKSVLLTNDEGAEY